MKVMCSDFLNSKQENKYVFGSAYNTLSKGEHTTVHYVCRYSPTEAEILEVVKNSMD